MENERGFIMNNKYKAIIFDMDGTLFDTEQISKIAWYEIGKKFNYPVSDEFILSLIGKTRESAQPQYRKYMPEHFDEDAAYAYRHEVMLKFKEEHGPLPKCDLKALFEAIKAKGYRIALCTGASRSSVDFNLNYVGCLDYFEVITDVSMVKKGKPAPDVYLHTAKLLNLDPKDCLVIEDNKNGILSGYDANMDVIMVIDMIAPDDECKAKTTHILDKLEDLLEVI